MSEWPAFLRLLNPKGDLLICPIWRMSNGSSFWMSVPSSENVFDDRLSDEHEFPFRLTEICEMVFSTQLAVGKHFIECDLNLIEAAALGAGMLIRREASNIIVAAKHEQSAISVREGKEVE